MVYLIVVVVLGLLFFFPFTRSLLLHPFQAVYCVIYDIYVYFHDKKYNFCESGFIDCYCGLFGSGKTVSAVSRLVSDFKRFNNKTIFIRYPSPRFDTAPQPPVPLQPGGGLTAGPESMEPVEPLEDLQDPSGSEVSPPPKPRLCYGEYRQTKINILSNVDLKGIPYTPLTSLQQIVDWTVYAPEHPEEWCLVLIDEASAILNSRDFSKNLNFYSINALVTCRHFNLGIVVTSQRFILIDKLLREVCQTVYQCRKIWRVIIQGVYDAYEVENSSDPTSIKPKTFRSIFCSNKVFRRYDTLATVGEIEKACRSGSMLSTQEILERKGETDPFQIPEKRKIFKFREKKHK